jgi:hypothetical protein
MQNKPNFRNAENVVSLVKTITNNNEQRTMNQQKQSQTKPICSELARPELVEGVESTNRGPIKPNREFSLYAIVKLPYTIFP